MQKAALARSLKFLAQIPHVHLHNIVDTGPLFFPDLLQQLVSAQNATLAPKQGKQQHKFPRGEAQESLPTPNLVR